MSDTLKTFVGCVEEIELLNVGERESMQWVPMGIDAWAGGTYREALVVELAAELGTNKPHWLPASTRQLAQGLLGRLADVLRHVPVGESSDVDPNALDAEPLWRVFPAILLEHSSRQNQSEVYVQVSLTPYEPARHALHVHRQQIWVRREWRARESERAARCTLPGRFNGLHPEGVPPGKLLSLLASQSADCEDDGRVPSVPSADPEDLFAYHAARGPQGGYQRKALSPEADALLKQLGRHAAQQQQAQHAALRQLREQHAGLLEGLIERLVRAQDFASDASTHDMVRAARGALLELARLEPPELAHTLGLLMGRGGTDTPLTIALLYWWEAANMRPLEEPGPGVLTDALGNVVDDPRAREPGQRFSPELEAVFAQLAPGVHVDEPMVHAPCACEAVWKLEGKDIVCMKCGARAPARHLRAVRPEESGDGQ